MKIKSSLLLVVALWLVSCAPVATVAVPTVTATIIPTATATETLLPTATFTPTITPTATEVPLPSFMDEFIRLGYDQQPLDQGTIYVVVDTASTSYPPNEAGLEYKGVVINSWSTIYYIDSGTLMKAYALNYACSKSKTDWDGYVCFASYGGSGSENPFPPTTKWAKAIWSQINAIIYDRLSTKYPIAKMELEQGISTSTEVLQNIYPPYSGKIEFVQIPGIGKVIAAQYFSIDLPAK